MLMRRRLYFMLPDVKSARAMLDEMLLARIPVQRIHFLAKRDTLPDDLPEANVLQKTDLVHGAQLGVVIGAAAGLFGGAVAMFFPPEGMSVQLVVVLIGGIAGALLGSWISSMAASAVPNTKLKAFHPEIERGRVLMMVDVPMRRAGEISQLVATRHPEAISGGYEPTIPAFP
ncbi:MAG TPA: DUF1269 domain-containing protein [Burkholderiales bacterium]|nr:DUF1269 domain-containing protein [Burkholderiales bacterium]